MAGGLPGAAGGMTLRIATLSSMLSAETPVPSSVGILFQLIPGLQRWSSKALSSAMTS